MPSNLDELLDDLLFNVRLDPQFVMGLDLPDMLRIHARAVRYQDRHRP
jgi:hypothetical protein